MFCVPPITAGTLKAMNFQIWPEHSQAQSEQKTVKKFGDERAWT